MNKKGGIDDENNTPTYLIQAVLKPETWAKLIENPEDRRGPSEEGARLYGGKILGYWYAFGEYDVYGVFEAPDSITAAMAQATVSAGGAYSRVKLTQLVTVDEMLEALKRAKTFPYTPPGQPPPADKKTEPQD